VLPAAFELLTGNPQPINAAAREIASRVDLPAALVMPALMHALWTHDIKFPFTEPLDSTTVISLPEDPR